MRFCECGHAMVFHGDRVLGACDGGIVATSYSQRIRSLCYCTGWAHRGD